MATQNLAPSPLADLIARPAPFNASKHGENVEFSEECSVAERVSRHNNGVVYTAQPVPVGEVWRITVLGTVDTWSGGLSVGLTTALPDDVPPEVRSAGEEGGPHEWIWEGFLIYHDNEVYSTNTSCRLQALSSGQSVGMLVTPQGQLHLFLDKEHSSEVVTGLPVDKPLWGVADVYGACVKIKSEMMGGKEAPDHPTESKKSPIQDDVQMEEPLKKPPASDDAQTLGTDEPLKSTIAMSDLTVSKDRLGGGAQGMVFKGTWKGIQVAVKKCFQPDPKDVRILLSLGSHSNVIRLYGVVVEDISCLIVTELVRGGSLYDFLYKEKKTPSDEQRSYWMKDIATGMEFLHHHGIAHRDLKSGIVLLGDRMTAKLCDFGTARSLNHTTAQSTVTGTYRWMAPEVVRDPNARINKKCDIYSYGMVLYELVTLKLPFHDAPTDQMAMVDAVMGKRPFLPESNPECPSFLHRLITACWDVDPKARPSFQEINVALDTKIFPQ